MKIFELLVFENLAIVVIAIIEQMFSKEGFTGVQRDGRHFGNGRSVDLLLYQLFTFIHNLYSLIIYNKMKMQTKVNCSSWNRLEFMDNVINMTFIRVDIERGVIVKFTSKGWTRRSKKELSFHWQVGWYFNLGYFIRSLGMNEGIVVCLNITQMPQIANLPKAKTKIIFHIGYDDLEPNVAIILFVHALHLQQGWIIGGPRRHFE